MEKFALVLCMSFISLSLHGQRLFIKNYPSNSYSVTGKVTSPQNWDITQLKNGKILVCNSSGIMLFNGIDWEMIEGTENKNIYSIDVDEAGKVFVGGSNEFGYIDENDLGKEVYISLSTSLTIDTLQSDIQSTRIVRDFAYFKTKTELIQYSKTDSSTKSFKYQSLYTRLYSLDNKVAFQNNNRELITFDGHDYDTLWYGNNQELPIITDIFTIDGSKLLVITKSNGFAEFDGVSLKFLDTDIKTISKQADLKSVVRINQDLYAIITEGMGVAITDQSGDLLQNITIDEGLLSNSGYSISVDDYSGLWVGLENGLARLEYPSSLSYYDQSNGLEGVVLGSCKFNNFLYVGTTSGLFVNDSEKGSSFEKLSNVNEVWDIKRLQGQVLVAASNGIYIAEGFSVKRISSEDSRTIVASNDSSRVWVGLRTGVGQLSWNDESWSWIRKYTEIDHQVRNIAQVGDTIWCTFESATRAIYDFKSDSFKEIIHLNPGVDFNDDLWAIEVSKVNDIFYFGTPKGIHRFSSESNSFLPDPTFGQIFSSGQRESFAIVQDQRGKVWLTSNRRNGPLERLPDMSYSWDTLSLIRLYKTDVWRIIPEKELIWFCTTDGLYRYEPNIGEWSLNPFPALINQIELNRDSTAYYSADIANIPSFSYELNDLRFRYSAASYNAGEELEYQFFMEGYDDDWSEWDKEVTKEYTNLSPGQYTFRVKAKNLYGKESNEAAFSFDILTPLHRSVTAYVFYSIFLIGLIYTGAKTQQRRIVARQKSKLKAREAELKKEREISRKLRMVDKLKDEFLANTSHELRTPLNGIIGISESLIDQDVPPDSNEIKENLSLVVASGKRLASMVDGILDYSKLRTANLELYKRTVDLKSLTEVVASMSRPLIKGHPVEIINALSDNLPQAWADENRVQQIMYNLIGNAIKFTEHGTITISAKVVENEIEVQIADTGVGIPEDKIDAIFESYEQLSESVDRDYIGTGLGLTITKKLVELHDGRIWVKSVVDQGSSLFFTLPISSEEIAPVRSTIPEWTRETILSNGGPKKEKGTGLKILVVDDEPVNQKVLSNILEAEGFQLTLASNGEKALELLDETHPDLVLLDIMMPKMSGYEVCEKIRSKRLMSELPVIFITAKNEIKDLVEGLSYGANDYVTKPFSKEEFLARVNTHLNLYKINDSYSRFVPHEFLRLLNRDSIMDVNLGDQIEKTVTILFSDIRGYTSISEKMTPKENFNYLNRYLKKVGPVISDNNGFISHYYGDGIMALFSESPEDALKASLEIVAKVREFNEDVVNEGLDQIQIGIGLHAGPSMLGILGDEKRMDASLVSDSVNIASRMEGLTKFYSASIIVSESTLQQIKNKDDYLHRFLGKVVVKGKSRTTNVIEIFEADDEKARALKLKTRPEFEVGIMNYLAKNFTEAAANFKNVIGANPDDAAANFYLKNSAKFMVEGVPDDWKGIENIQFK